jgi:hypothetical protein
VPGRQQRRPYLGCCGRCHPLPMMTLRRFEQVCLQHLCGWQLYVMLLLQPQIHAMGGACTGPGDSWRIQLPPGSSGVARPPARRALMSTPLRSWTAMPSAR